MSNAYWNQWDKEELDSWQGIEEDYDDEEDDSEVEEIAEEGCSCGYYCFDCLGMSWRDFM